MHPAAGKRTGADRGRALTQFVDIVTTNILFSLGWTLIAWTRRAGLAAVLIGTALALVWVSLWLVITQVLGDLITHGPADVRTAAMWNWGTGAAACALAALAAFFASRRLSPNAYVVFLFVFFWSGGLIVAPLWMSDLDGWFTAQWAVIVALGALIVALPFTRRSAGER